MAIYEYSISEDFSNGVDGYKFQIEIDDSAITSADIVSISTKNGTCYANFDDTLSSGDETILDGLVDTHDGLPLPDINEFDGTLSSKDGFFCYSIVENREKDIGIYPDGNDLKFKDKSVGPYTLSQLYSSSGDNFGNDYQTQVSLSRSSTTSSIPQTKVTLTTPALTGTYRLNWQAALDNNVSISCIRLYNDTDEEIVGIEQCYKAPHKDCKLTLSGFGNVVFSGSLKVFKLQYHDEQGNHEVGIQDAKIEIWRVI